MYFSLEQIIFTTGHSGLRSNRWNPRVSPYIIGSKGPYDFFKPQLAFGLLRRSVFFIKTSSFLRKNILFSLGSNPYWTLLTKYPLRCFQPYVGGSSSAGFLTNFYLVGPRFGNFGPMPDVAIVLDLNSNIALVNEATVLDIPFVCVCNTNHDVNFFSYPVLSNDRSFLSLSFLSNLFSNAVQVGVGKLAEFNVDNPQLLLF